MSDLQKQRVKAAMHSVMAPPPLLELNELDEEDHYASTSVPNVPQDDDSSSASSVSSTGTVIPSPGRALFARPQGVPRGRSFDPIPWTTYFERELFLPSPDGSVTYHAYLTSPAPPSAPGKAPGPLFVTHHGAGSSGLSFAVLSAEIRKRLPSAGILSLDARGHGLTTTSSSSTADENEPEDLTLPTLAHDLLTLLSLTKSHLNWPTLPPLLLIGHSLGGAVVTEFASTLLPSLPRSSPPTPGFQLLSQQEIDLLGYAVLDVVEGSAMDALQSMHAYLATRPAGFDSLRDAIEWHVRTRTVRNGVSARASVPGLLVHCEQSQSEGEAVAAVGGRRDKAWRWRTDLARTQPFWEGWFRGLSGKFLRGRGGKMLLLAGTDRLDTELTIGQMQGKYALQVFPEAGHFIHEDLPEKTAMALVDFHRRNDRSALVLPPKVSELLAQGKKV